MSPYLIAKWLHVLSSTILFGTGIGSAYYMFFASRSGYPRVVAHVVRRVVIADWLFTTTTIVFQPLSGLYLAHVAHFPLTSFWIVASFALYVIAVAAAEVGVGLGMVLLVYRNRRSIMLDELSEMKG